MPENRKALIIVNKRSGTSYQDLDEALNRLRAGGFDVDVFFPDDPAEIGEIIRKRSKGLSTIILGGGDGTLSASAADLLPLKLTVGVVPLGTANDFARGLGIPTDLSAAAEIIVQGHKRSIDVGIVNDRPFLNVASIGMAVDVARFHKGERKRRFKLLSYPLSWVDAYRSHRPFRADLRCDGNSRLGRFSQIAIASGRHYGGGMTIEASAQVDDGWLHVYYVKPRDLWGWLRLLPALRFGTIDREERAEALLAKQVTIVTRRKKVINVDGELSETTPAKFRILPQSLTVFAPPAAAEREQVSNARNRPMDILRNDYLVALNDLVLACRNAANSHSNCAMIAGDTTLGKALSSLCQERTRVSDELAEVVIAENDVPMAPSGEKDVIEKAVLQAKAVLGDSPTEDALKECRAREEEIVAAARKLLEFELDGSLRARVKALSLDATERLTELEGKN